MSESTRCLRSFFGLNFTFIQKASSFSDGLVREEIFRDYVMSVLQRSSSGPSNDEDDDDDGDLKRWSGLSEDEQISEAWWGSDLP